MNAGREQLRPAAAAERFGVSERTLSRWRAAGLIGWSKVGNVVLLDAGDIADVIRAAYVPRRVVPLSPERAAANAAAGSDDWRRDPLWKGTEVGR